MDKWLGGPPSVMLPRLRSLIEDMELLASLGRFPNVDDAVRVKNCLLGSRAVPCLVGEFAGHPTVQGFGISSELFYLDRKKRLGRTLSRWYRFDDGLL